MKTRTIPKWRQWLARKLAPVAQRSGYVGAMVSRLTDDWITSNLSANSEIWGSLDRLRSRSRDVARNNRYMQKARASRKANIVGANGFTLQMRALDPNGKPDKLANDTVEIGFWEWSKNVTVDGISWLQACLMVVDNEFIDGEILIRRRFDRSAKHPLRLELIEADRLDEAYTGTCEGNRVFMGVEVNEFNRPIYYHILNYVPSDPFMTPSRTRRRERVPASEIIHIFRKDRPGQLRGVPRTAPVLVALHNIEGYEQAEVIAARAAANKMGFFSSPDGEQYKGAEQDEAGAQIMDAAPGQLESIGRLTFKEWDPKHPTQNYPSFVKTQLQGISGGLGESYNILANDLEGVNYSSLRGGLLDVRETYMLEQEWLVQIFITPVFDWWIESELMAGALLMPNGSALPLRKLHKFNSAEWKGRRWPWVDPLKDMEAIEKALALKITSRKKVLAEMGGPDVEETFRDIQQDEELADAYDIDLPDDAEILKAQAASKPNGGAAPQTETTTES